MEIEQKQADIIGTFVNQAATASPPSLAALLAEATSHPSLFAFSEILSLPNLAKLEGTAYASSLALVRLFAYGTWSDYKSNVGSLPPLLPDQIRKLKQLSVLTFAENNKILPYDQLMQELDVANVRELEDFLIECMYAGIVRGKLDQFRRCFEVQFSAGRDLKPEQLNGMIETLANWLSTSDNLLQTIKEKIKWADTMGEADMKHRKEVEGMVEDAKKSSLKVSGIMRLHVFITGLMTVYAARRLFNAFKVMYDKDFKDSFPDMSGLMAVYAASRLFNAFKVMYDKDFKDSFPDMCIGRKGS